MNVGVVLASCPTVIGHAIVDGKQETCARLIMPWRERCIVCELRDRP